MEATTIKIQQKTKHELDKFREYKNESYDEVIRKMIYIADMAKRQPRLSREAIDAIDRARERMRNGKFATEGEARRRLGL